MNLTARNSNSLIIDLTREFWENKYNSGQIKKYIDNKSFAISGKIHPLARVHLLGLTTAIVDHQIPVAEETNELGGKQGIKLDYQPCMPKCVGKSSGQWWYARVLSHWLQHSQTWFSTCPTISRVLVNEIQIWSFNPKIIFCLPPNMIHYNPVPKTRQRELIYSCQEIFAFSNFCSYFFQGTFWVRNNCDLSSHFPFCLQWIYQYQRLYQTLYLHNL